MQFIAQLSRAFATAQIILCRHLHDVTGIVRQFLPGFVGCDFEGF